MHHTYRCPHSLKRCFYRVLHVATMAVNCSSVTKEGITSGDFLMARSVNAVQCKGDTEKQKRIKCKSNTKQAIGRNTRNSPTTRVASLPSQLCSNPTSCFHNGRDSFLTLFALSCTDAALSCWIKHAKQCFYVILCKYA